MTKILTVYFSHAGENYFGGSIRNIEKGNTERAAEFIAEATGSDLFRIETVEDYPVIYSQCTDQAKQEKNSNARPALKKTADFADYDVIFLGYPNWWGTMPMAVVTQLENTVTAGKKILPICTNEGSGLGSSVRDLKKICPEAVIGEGLSVYGSEIAMSKGRIQSWAKKNI